MANQYQVIVTVPRKLAEQRCPRCGALGITVLALETNFSADPARQIVAHEYCTPDCARSDGWPWLASEVAK
jgi:hypothetical protein